MMILIRHIALIRFILIHSEAKMKNKTKKGGAYHNPRLTVFPVRPYRIRGGHQEETGKGTDDNEFMSSSPPPPTPRGRIPEERSRSEEAAIKL